MKLAAATRRRSDSCTWLKLVYFDLLRLAMELCQLQHPDHGRGGAATDRASDRYRVMQIPWDSNRRFGWG